MLSSFNIKLTILFGRMGYISDEKNIYFAVKDKFSIVLTDSTIEVLRDIYF